MLRTVSPFVSANSRTPAQGRPHVEKNALQDAASRSSASTLTQDTVHFGAWGNEIDAYTDELMAKKIGYYQDKLNKTPGDTDKDKIVFLLADEDRTSERPDKSYYHDTKAHREVTRTIYFQLAGNETVYVLERTRAMDKDRWKTASISEVPRSDSSEFPGRPVQWGWHNKVKMEEEGTSEKGIPFRSTVYYPIRYTRGGDVPRSESQDNVNSLMELVRRLGDVLDRALMEHRFNPPPEPED